MQFAKIGMGYKRTTKSGKPAIVLKLDKNVQEQIANHDFAYNIWIFKNDRGYTAMAPMPDDYEFTYEKSQTPSQKPKIKATSY